MERQMTNPPAKAVPRGIRNNNPGNIDFSKANDWLGQLPFDPAIESRFARFDTPQHGIRALAKTLLSYQRKHGLKTVRAMIGRWAPCSENDTSAYARAVEARLQAEQGILPGADIDLQTRAVLVCLVQAIILHENGTNPYSRAVIEEGVAKAFA
jgi:hypothetical protein